MQVLVGTMIDLTNQREVDTRHRTLTLVRTSISTGTTTSLLLTLLCISNHCLMLHAGLSQVPYEEGQQFADSRNIPFVECSSKENVNVSEVFTTLLKQIESENGTFDEEVRKRVLL